MEGLHEVGEGVWGVDEIVWVCGGVDEIVWMMIRGRASCIAWCGTSLSVEHLRLLSAPRCYKLSRMEKALPPAMHVELLQYSARHVS